MANEQLAAQTGRAQWYVCNAPMMYINPFKK